MIYLHSEAVWAANMWGQMCTSLSLFLFFPPALWLTNCCQSITRLVSHLSVKSVADVFSAELMKSSPLLSPPPSVACILKAPCCISSLAALWYLVQFTVQTCQHPVCYVTVWQQASLQNPFVNLLDIYVTLSSWIQYSAHCIDLCQSLLTLDLYQNSRKSNSRFSAGSEAAYFIIQIRRF